MVGAKVPDDVKPKTATLVSTAVAARAKASKSRLLLAVAGMYLLWLGWLLYVGIVNYRAGNQ